RYDAPADVAERCDDGFADADVAADPLVLLVLTDAVDLEEHPELASVGRVRLACRDPEPLERGAGDDRRPAAAVRATVDGALLRPQQHQRLAGELRDRLLPRPADAPGRMRDAVERRLDALAGLHD